MNESGQITLLEKIVQLGIVCSYPLLLETPMGKQYPVQNKEPLLGSPIFMSVLSVQTTRFWYKFP